MIYAAYNGVPMRSLGDIDQLRELTYSDDGVQPIGVHVDFKGVFAVNPGLLSAGDMQRADAGVYEPVLEGNGLVVPAGNLSPAELYVMAVQRLEVARRPFVLWAYAGAGPNPRRVVLLQSPLKDGNGNWLSCDMEDGPVPKVSWTHFDTGAGTLMVGFNVETTIPLCHATSAPAIVSNRWTLTVGLDQDFYAQHTINGRAVFRKDLMNAKGLTPDMVRGWFMHPVPMGFRRGLVETEYDRKGNAVDYSITDTEQAVNQPGVAAYGASRVEVTHQRELTGPSPFSFLTPG